MNLIANELLKRYEEVEPREFYRDIFPEGELDIWREDFENLDEHKYTGILVEVEVVGKDEKGKPIEKAKRFSITDEMDELETAYWGKNFCVMAPISYVGKSRKSENARYMYALVIEVDNLRTNKQGEQVGLKDLEFQCKNKIHPQPTYIVASGNGIHLYYVFEKPIPLYQNVAASLAKLKRRLTERLWNKYVTFDYKPDKVQQESIFQAFRVVGSITKKGDRVSAFRTGEKVTLEYLNRFVEPEHQASLVYHSKLSLEKAQKLYPEWYQKRIIDKKPKDSWKNSRALYEWWKRKIMSETTVGHRYYCLMMLCIYAIKCDIPREELEKDCYEIADHFEAMTNDDNNHFTRKDVRDALKSFKDKGLITYPVNSIANRSGIHIDKNKRNGRKQAQHVAIMNFIRDMKYENGSWRNLEGRPKGSSKEREVIALWRSEFPEGTPKQCIADTGFSKNTVYRWWNDEIKRESEHKERSGSGTFDLDEGMTLDTEWGRE